MKFSAGNGSNGEGGDHGWEDPPAGAHVARCIQIIDLGTQEDKWADEKKLRRKVYLQWELGNTKISKTGRPFVVGQKYTASMFKNAGLRKLIESWSGRKFASDDEAEAFDLKNLLGVNAYITLNLNEKGKVELVSVIGRPKEIPAAPRVNELVFLSLDKAEYDATQLPKVGKFWREMLTASPEYAALVTGREPEKTPTGGTPTGADDDIPF